MGFAGLSRCNLLALMIALVLHTGAFFIMETTFERIIRKSGMKPVSCKCQLCKSQCHQPCWGTPEDMHKIIDAGFVKRCMVQVYGETIFVTPLLDKSKSACTFFTDGLCELHDLGLKPTVGKLSHHSTSLETFKPKKSIAKFVLDEWKNIDRSKILEMFGITR